jgi:hypothetical protein
MYQPGNNFWELRSKHGRDKLFETPELMWEAALEYFKWCVDNPLIEIDFKGKDADRVEIPKMRAFTYQGLTSYLDCGVEYFRQFKARLVGKNDSVSRDFSRVIVRIEETIYNQKFTGAAAGFLNPNIIARDLGLSEKTEAKIDHTLTQQVDYSQLSDETLKELENAAGNQHRLS